MKDVKQNPWIFDAATQGEGYANKDSYLLLSTFTTTNATNHIDLTAHGFETGDGPVQVSNSGGALPTGYTASTDYYVIKVDADNFKLASSLANAIAGTVVAISDDGSGTHSLNAKPTFIGPIPVEEMKFYSGSSGGDLEFHDKVSGRSIVRLDNVGADTTISIPFPDDTFVKGLYLTTLATAGKVWVYLGNR